MNIWGKIKNAFQGGEPSSKTTEKGTPFDGNRFARMLYGVFALDHDQRSILADIKRMDRDDGRVKRIHSRLGKDTTRGGLSFIFDDGKEDSRLSDESRRFIKRLHLDKRKKLKGHARDLVMTGELFLQWIVDEELNIVDVKHLPPASMKPNVDDKGRFRDPEKAYVQFDPVTGQKLTEFARWQITHVAIDGNPDDPGSRGRPLMDASRKKWKQLDMLEEDLVIRRRMRAALRLVHLLDGATEEEISAYKARNKDALQNPLDVTSDFFTNKKGAVTALEGDANMDQIKDVKKLQTDFFVGAGIPEHLMGEVSGVNRDVYEDSLGDYYEILEEIQETQADGYEEGFRLQLLLRGINADDYDWQFKFTGRKVESPNQLADRMLKHHALGIPFSLIWPALGLSVDKVNAAREEEASKYDPYAERVAAEGKTQITSVQGNQRGKESAVYVPANGNGMKK